MLSPNTVQKTSVGMMVKTASSGAARPSNAAPLPSWNTSTTAPNPAATDSRLRHTALRGTSTDRNPRNNATSVPPSTSATTKGDRKSTRLNSSHGYISYAVFCLKKKKNKEY